MKVKPFQPYRTERMKVRAPESCELKDWGSLVPRMKPQYEDTVELPVLTKIPTACLLSLHSKSYRGNTAGNSSGGKHVLVKNRINCMKPEHVADLVEECPGPREQCTGNLVRTELSSNGTQGDSQSPRNKQRKDS